VDPATIYWTLRDAAETHGWVGKHADELLFAAAQSIADDPKNAD